MRPKGTIYDRRKGKKHGEIVVSVSRGLKLVYGLLRGVGAGLVGFAVIGLLFSYGPIVKEEVGYYLYSLDYKETYATDEAENVRLAEAQSTKVVQDKADSLGVDSHFAINIPKINAASNIIANVDPSDKQSYEDALMNGVAHARGTYFPGQDRNVFMFAHSTDSTINVARYNAVFFLLRKLEAGDRIEVFFADEIYTYEVTEKLVTETDDVSWLENDPEEGERLILQTCDPPGTTWNRLLVIAEPVNN